MNKKFVIISIVVALLIVATITVSSYAYFTINNKDGVENVITSGTMSLLFTDGNEITANDLLPGQSIEKEFAVKNTGNIDTVYDVYLSDVINTFVDKTDLVYELTSNDGGYNTTNQTQVPSTSSKIVNNQAINVGDTHHYKLKITFLNKDENQDDNQGKVFSAKIQVNEYENIETTVNYYLNRVLVSEMPNNSNTYINYECNNGATVSFDEVNWTYNINNITSNHTVCNINFFQEGPYEYDYMTGPDGKGVQQTFVAPLDGRYKLEVWGAQGGTIANKCDGGYGAYSVGVVELETDDILNIVVGGQASGTTGGYNGGGNGGSKNYQYGYGGGGATHIATDTGLLSSLSDKKSSVLIVAGAGGGAGYTEGYGKSTGSAGGGESGVNGYDYYNKNSNYTGYGGSQGSGGTYSGFQSNTNCSLGKFGQGGNFCDLGYGSAGGGGGWYGGAGSARGHSSSGGGSGYIGKELLESSNSIVKHMTCYKCNPSDTPESKTERNECHNPTANEDCSKEGNGYVRITLLT